MLIRTSEAEIAEKIKISSLGEKLGVLIKWKRCICFQRLTNSCRFQIWFLQQLLLLRYLFPPAAAARFLQLLISNIYSCCFNICFLQLLLFPASFNCFCCHIPTAAVNGGFILLLSEMLPAAADCCSSCDQILIPAAFKYVSCSCYWQFTATFICFL